MSDELIIKNFIADGIINPYRIVKHNNSDNDVVQASAETDYLLGVADEVGASSNTRADIIMSGIAQVEYGGTVTRGEELTSDANGKAISLNALPKGANYRSIGRALVSGVSGDIGSVLIGPCVMNFPGVSYAYEVSSGTITVGCIVKHGAADDTVAKAATSTDSMFGVMLETKTSGATGQVQVMGIAEALAGASITRGQLLTANTSGKVIPVNPAANTTIRTIGNALESGDSDNYIKININPASYQATHS